MELILSLATTVSAASGSATSQADVLWKKVIHVKRDVQLQSINPTVPIDASVEPGPSVADEKVSSGDSLPASADLDTAQWKKLSAEWKRTPVHAPDLHSSKLNTSLHHRRFAQTEGMQFHKPTHSPQVAAPQTNSALFDCKFSGPNGPKCRRTFKD